jgi:predicted PurR-regulated permease PerM
MIMIALVHAFESYVLNPKLMSAKVELPIFFTFIILLVAEHLIGVWGLLIGIPLFIFLLEILDVKL